MTWPLSQDYNEAIQSSRGNFSDPDLQGSEAVTNPLGIPLPCSGNFADVYQMRGRGEARWAVKCFTREVPGLRERYAAISRHLREANLPFSVDFTFLQQGIRVRGRWYPILKMQWVEGLTLNAFVRQYADKPAMMTTLLQIWVRMAARLRAADLAHADLQHGNVLLVPHGTGSSLAVKLIDYDGMWVPALAKTPSGEAGHPCYQHPQRLAERTYSRELDRFPLLLIATALAGLKVGGQALWNKYDSGDNLLFRETDLKAPDRSPLLQELLKLGDERAAKLARYTLNALKGRLESAPMLAEVLPELQAPSAPKPTGASKRTVVPTTASGSPWDFEGEDKSPRRRRTKSGTPRWVWAIAGAGAAALVVAGGIFMLTPGKQTEKPKNQPRIAQNQAEQLRQRAEKKHAEEELPSEPPTSLEPQDADDPPAKKPDLKKEESRPKVEPAKPEATPVPKPPAKAPSPEPAKPAGKAAEVLPRRTPVARPADVKEVATKNYEKSCTAARTRFLKAFDTVAEQMSRRKGSTETKRKWVEIVKEEKRRFENKEWIPWSAPMRPYLDQYLSSTHAAEAKLRSAFKSLIAAQRRAKNETKAAELRAELENLAGAKIVAKWHHHVNGRPGGVNTFYSNGKINGIDGPATWSIGNGVLIMRWPAPRVQGGAWIDTCTIAADGTRCEGANQQKAKISEVYVKD